MNETTNCQVSSAIIYGIEDRPPFKEAFFFCCITAFISHLCCYYNPTVNYCRSIES